MKKIHFHPTLPIWEYHQKQIPLLTKQGGTSIDNLPRFLGGDGACREPQTLECLRFLLQVYSPKDFLQLQTSSQFCLLFSPSCLRSDLAGIWIRGITEIITAAPTHPMLDNLIYLFPAKWTGTFRKQHEGRGWLPPHQTPRAQSPQSRCSGVSPEDKQNKQAGSQQIRDPQDPWTQRVMPWPLKWQHRQGGEGREWVTAASLGSWFREGAGSFYSPAMFPEAMMAMMGVPVRS